MISRSAMIYHKPENLFPICSCPQFCSVAKSKICSVCFCMSRNVIFVYEAKQDQFFSHQSSTMER